jgi:hypothetical protein
LSAFLEIEALDRYKAAYGKIIGDDVTPGEEEGGNITG